MAAPVRRLALLALLLTACGGGPSGGGTTTPTPNPTPTPGPTPDPAPGTCTNQLSGVIDLTVATAMTNGPAACDYLIDGYVNVTSVLTIEPGTVIRFGQDSELRVGPGGVLNSVGTANARIRMEGLNKTKGYWEGVSFGPGARESRIEYTDIESAGQTGYLKNYAGVSGIDGTLTFRNNTVSGSYAHGMTIPEDSRLLIKSFANNRFFDNVGFGLKVSATQTGVLDAASDYLGGNQPNGLPYVKIDWDDVYGNTTWKKINAPYFVSIALYYKGGLLTVEPGVKVVMDDGAVLNIHGGAIRAVGTPQDPIVFTGVTQEKGSWDGIDFFYSRSDANVLQNVRVLYGGGAGANVFVGHGSSLRISDSLVAHSGGYGLCLNSLDFGDANATLDIGSGMTYEGNAAGNVNLECE
ncbi:hypothetical protein [Deinococcus aestuarii]|uniref:hypothetical protein n=1 Tax=Deinococcus aestuarii TaxID=2774531 RepID=UPI001C0D97BB|nr:hypothetical protein [Deinococcus aestuarii]